MGIGRPRLAVTEDINNLSRSVASENDDHPRTRCRLILLMRFFARPPQTVTKVVH